jgi:hypothetical protein
MTVRAALQSIVSLTGATNVCACSDGGKNPIAHAALIALNRAMQEVWLAPSARGFILEPLTVSFPSAAPVDLPANVQTVVGPVRRNGARPVHLAATATEFNSYFLNHQDRHFDDQIYDDIRLDDLHDVSNGLPYWENELLLPLWDDRSILIWFDDSAGSHSRNLTTAAATAGGLPLNGRTVSVRVELPAVDTAANVIAPLIKQAIDRYAGQFLQAALVASTTIRLYRRRTEDVSPWQTADPIGVNVVHVPGPRVPVVAWAEELKTSDSGQTDLARIRLHLLPAASGTVTVNVITEPPSYTLDDLDCDGDGFNSTPIKLGHQYAESLLLPLARLAFAQDNAAYITAQAVASMPAIEAAAASARVAHGLASANAPQTMQRTKTTAHDHA